MSRTRTISWHDPVDDRSAGATDLTGLEALHRIGNGLLPPPPVADLVGFHPIFVTPGYVVFAYEPREEHYNTLGAVHGGIVTTVLDTVMGCAVHSKLDAGVGPGHDRAEDELRPPGHAGIRPAPGRGQHRPSRLARRHRRGQAARRGGDALRARVVELADLRRGTQGEARSRSRPDASTSGSYNGSMEPLYRPEGVEERWQQAWESEGLYRAGAGKRRDETFVICVPPPNVTGALHMGHALNGSLQDVLTRWHRMQGFDTLWQPGYDHAGIATQNVVEKQLAKEGTSRKELGREAFVERVWRHLEETGRTIIGQFRSLGASLDYSRERFTMDDAYVEARDALLRPPLGPRVDLPRRADRQLVPVPRDGDLRPRGRARRHGRHADLCALPLRRRLRSDHDRDRAPGDDPRRRRGRRPPRRRALPGRDRQAGRRPLRRAGGPGDRGRPRRARVRHRRAQDHAGPRSDRLRDRPRPRARDPDRDRSGRADERERRRPRRQDAAGGRRGDPRLAEGARPARAAGALPPRGRHLRALPHADRAAGLAAVVGGDGGAAEARARGAAGAARPLPPGVAAPVRDPLARGDPGLEHLAAALVGPPAAALVLPRRPRHLRLAAAGRLRRMRLGRARARSGRARHLVLVRALAVRHARLAGADARARALLPRQRQLDRARDHPPLGEQDDLDGARAAWARSRSPT